MTKRLFLKTLAGAAIVLACAGAHAQDSLARVKQAGVLKVGTETAFAPFDFVKEGDHAGLNVDVFNEISKEMGVKLEWVLLPWEGVLPGLETNKFDMVAGPATITKARLERYRFSVPVAEATAAFLKRKGDASVMKPADIAGKTIGGAKSSSQLATTKPMPTWQLAGLPWFPIRCPTLPMWRSSAPIPLKWCSRRLARRATLATSAARTPMPPSWPTRWTLPC